MSIADKLTQLDEIRSDMREKLVAKGVSASDHNFADFAADIAAIPSGGGTDGQFFPMNMIKDVLPTMTLTYGGNDI